MARLDELIRTTISGARFATHADTPSEISQTLIGASLLQTVCMSHLSTLRYDDTPTSHPLVKLTLGSIVILSLPKSEAQNHSNRSTHVPRLEPLGERVGGDGPIV
jgi:hypothetical protein